MAINRQRLMGAARRLLASHADAEDAVQDTYVRALVSCPDWLTAESGWMHTVLRNIAIDRLRRQRLESQHAEIPPPPQVSVESPIEVRSECEAALRHLLSRVTPPDAAVILLCDVFEFDYVEIAGLVGKNHAAFRQSLHRARMRARRAGATTEAEEALVAMCWRAIEARDPRPLMNLLQTPLTASMDAAIKDVPQRGARTYSHLVQVNGQYAIALVLNGIVLCLVPVGTRVTLLAESV